MSQNGWNSNYNSAKGALLVGNGTRPEIRTVGADGFVLTANSAQADGVEWAAPGAGTSFSSIVQQIFTANGTYTPTAGMSYCIVEVVGGGGGGSGHTSIATAIACGTGGGGGGYSREVFDAATIGVSQAVTIGAAGVGGILFGTAGSTTSFGALLSATGGAGGLARAADDIWQPGVAGGTGSGALSVAGQDSGGCMASPAGMSLSGDGGGSVYGNGGKGAFITTQIITITGSVGTGYGAGGGGGLERVAAPPTGVLGGNGTAGICIVTEYIA